MATSIVGLTQQAGSSSCSPNRIITSNITHGMLRCLSRRVLTGGAGPAQRSRCVARASGDGSTDGEDSPEALFQKELAKRGLGGAAVKSEDKPDSGSSGSASSSAFSQFRQTNGASSSDQLERSRRLNSEGLEGFIPRATELVKLGGTFWLNFWPFIAAIVVSFLALYAVDGSQFIHGGDVRMAVPEYIDKRLLEDGPDAAETQRS